MPDAIHPIIKADLEYMTNLPLDWMRFKQKRILITGASGFLPAYMVETLLFLNTVKNLDCKITGLVRDPSKAAKRFAVYQNRSDLELLPGDVSQPQPWKQRFDFVIHAASQASPKYYGPDPVGTMNANLLGSNHLLEQSYRWSTEKFLFFSSGEVYGQLPIGKVPTTESDYGYLDINNPRSCYAESKRAAETLAISYARQYNIPVSIVRPFHTYGPGMALDDGRVYADFVRDALMGKNINMLGDGRAIRSFCYLSDAVAGFFTVLLKGTNSTAYNVGNPSAALSIAELATLIARLDPARPLNVVSTQRTDKSYLPSSIPANIPNIDRISSLGWTPCYLPAEGFKRTLQYFKQP